MRWRRLTVAIAAIVVVGVGVVATVIRKGPRAADLQRLKPTSPVVDRLRGEVRGANVVICVIDAARADHVGCYGYLRDTTPNIDRLARESVVFREHFAEYPSTKPSTALLLTGQHSDTHLAYGNRELPEGTFTLAKGLERAGLRTVMFSSNPNASPATGLGRDFREVFDQSEVEPLVEGWEQFTNPKPLMLLRWLDFRHEQLLERQSILGLLLEFHLPSLRQLMIFHSVVMDRSILVRLSVCLRQWHL